MHFNRVVCVAGSGSVALLAGSAMGGLNLIEAGHETSLVSYLSVNETVVNYSEIDNSYHPWDGSPGYPALAEGMNYLHGDGINGVGRVDAHSNTSFGGSGADGYSFAFDTAMGGWSQGEGVVSTQITAFDGSFVLIADTDLEVEISMRVESLGGSGLRSLSSSVGVSRVFGENFAEIVLPDDGGAFAEEMTFRTNVIAGEILRLRGSMYASQGSDDGAFTEWDLEGVSVSGSIVVVPGPGSVGALGIAGLFAMRRRRSV